MATGLAAGAAIYLILPVEPGPAGPAALALAGILAAAWLHRTGRATLALVVVLVLAGLLAGFARTQTRMTGLAAAPSIETGGEAQLFTGWLEAVETTAAGRTRLLVRLRDDTAGPPRRLRVRATPGDLVPGDPVAVRAVVMPPPGAAVPGAYDFSFHALSARIAGTGFAIAPVGPGPPVAGDAWARRLAALRWSLAERIRAQLPPRTGGMAAALLTGDRSGLDRGDILALRQSGLGHLLAISGMHMALFAGGIYFGLRAALAAWPAWAARHDAARPAAIAALLAALAYLILSGASIPTQRAFIMTASVLGAVMIGRRALSLHTLAVAMMIVLWLRPEAVLTPGFQMSFAAVAALIAAAQYWQSVRPPPAPFAPFRGLRQFIGGLSSTSLIAGFATGGFAGFHFHRLATFGLAGNLLAMPVFSLLVMPAGVIALFLMPLGLEGPALWVMGQGLSVVLFFAHWVSSWPGAHQPVAAGPGWVLGVYALGFALVVAGRSAVRLAGAAIAGLALLGWQLATPPDIFVSEQGVVLLRGEDGAWQVSDRRRGRFPVQVFLERAGASGTPGRLPQTCDTAGCLAETPGLVLALPRRPEALAEDCARAALIVTPVEIPPHRQRRCAARVIDGGILAARGAAEIRLKPGGEIAAIRHARPSVPRRIWQRREISRR